MMYRVVTAIIFASVLISVFIASNANAQFPGDFPWVTGFDRTNPGARGPVPSLNTPFTDQVHGTTIQRITHDANSWRRHEYSRRPVFNVDSSRLILRSSGGWWHLYRIAGDHVVFEKTLPSPMEEPNWHPTDPDRYWYFERDGQGLKLHEFNVATDRSRVAADFSGRLPWRNATRAWTRWEGRPSRDGRIWCLMAEDDDFKTLGIFSYDLERDRILGTLDLNQDPDHISTSVNGQHCVPSGAGPFGTRAYTLSFRSFQQLHSASTHSDLALDAGGNDVYVLADFSAGRDGGWIRMVDIATGRSTRLVPIYERQGAHYSLHLSGLATDAPGHVVLSTYGAKLDYGRKNADYGDIWGHDRLSVIELKANPKVFNVAYMRNGRGGYWSEPQATVNRDLTRIVYASTWGSTDDADSRSYMVSLNQPALSPSQAKRLIGRKLTSLERRIAKLNIRDFRNRRAKARLIARLEAMKSAHDPLKPRRLKHRARQFAGRVNGCGATPDRSDYVINCHQQKRLYRAVSGIQSVIGRL